MELEASIPWSQELSAGLHPEPDQSSPYNPTLFKTDINIIHPPTYRYS
jgi:hypothetical protein